MQGQGVRLSRHFRLSEFTKSGTAVRLGINNRPPAAVVRNLKALCVDVLEVVRVNVGMPVVVNSGFRCHRLNEAIGGSPYSQHTIGEAADIEVPGLDNRELWEWMLTEVAYDQLILEKYREGDPASGWIHVSYRRPNRSQPLIYDGKHYRSP